jgi:hypothetical protein
MSTLFACPSPSGKNRLGLRLDADGGLRDSRGAYWGRSQIMAMDSAMKPRRKLAYDVDLSAANAPSGEVKKPFNPAASTARGKLDGALKSFCEATGLQHEDVAEQLDELLDGYERERVRAHAESLGVGGGGGKGKGALDDTEENEELDELDQKVKQYLENHGMDPVSVKQALEIMRRDRAAAAVSDDELPSNARHGGPPIKQRLETDEELETQYPGVGKVLADPMGERPSNMSPDPVKRLSERAVSKVAGGGTGRRLATPPGASDAGIRASDAELAKEYPGIENCIAGV